MLIREQRNMKVQSQLGQGSLLPPALPAPPGTICRYYSQGSRQKGDACDMVHCDIAKTACAALVRAGGAGAENGGGKGGGGGGGQSAAKGGGKGQPQAKAAPGPNGRGVNTKGGTTTSHLPCYANYEGKCKDGATCRLCHRSLTPAELPLYTAWKAKSATRPASPGAPASGVCPDFLKGTCALGAQCAMEHPEGPSKTALKKAARAAAKAAASP